MRRQTPDSHERKRRSGAALRPFAWVAFSLLALAGIWLAWVHPGDLAYWVTPTTLLPLIYIVCIEYEDRWRTAGPLTKRIVWSAAVALALGGGLWATLDPGARSWVLGFTMTIPMLLLLAPIVGRAGSDGHLPGDGLGSGPAGPP